MAFAMADGFLFLEVMIMILPYDQCLRSSGLSWIFKGSNCLFFKFAQSYLEFTRALRAIYSTLLHVRYVMYVCKQQRFRESKVYEDATF